MTNLTEKEILDLAYEDGLYLGEESKYGSKTDDEILSYKEFLKTTKMKDTQKALNAYKVSIEGSIVFLK